MLPQKDLPANVSARDPVRVARAVRLARLLDDRFLDPILGVLLPELGDTVGMVLGLYPVFVAYREGLPRTLLARMVLNLALDLFVGAIPALGDIFDFAFRANRRNAEMLEAYVQTGTLASTPSARAQGGGWLLLAALGVLGGALVFSVWVGLWVMSTLWTFLAGAF